MANYKIISIILVIVLFGVTLFFWLALEAKDQTSFLETRSTAHELTQLSNSLEIGGAIRFHRAGSEISALVTKSNEQAKLVLLNHTNNTMSFYPIDSLSQAWVVVWDGTNKLFIGGRDKNKNSSISVFDLASEKIEKSHQIDSGSLVTSMHIDEAGILAAHYPSGAITFHDRKGQERYVTSNSHEVTKCLSQVESQMLLSAGGSPGFIHFFDGLEEKTTILGEESYVYSCHFGNNSVLFGTQGKANVYEYLFDKKLLMPRLRLINENTVDGITRLKGNIYVTSRPSGNIKIFDEKDYSLIKEIHVPGSSQHRAIGTIQDYVYGIKEDGTYWTIRDDKIEILKITDNISQIGSSILHSLFATSRKLFMFGNNTMEVYDLDRNKIYGRFEIDGEAKVVIATDKKLIVFVYEGCKVYSIKLNKLSFKIDQNDIKNVSSIKNCNRPLSAVRLNDESILLVATQMSGYEKTNLFVLSAKNDEQISGPYSFEHQVTDVIRCDSKTLIVGHEVILHPRIRIPLISWLNDEMQIVDKFPFTIKNIFQREIVAAGCFNNKVFALTKNGKLLMIDKSLSRILNKIHLTKDNISTTSMQKPFMKKYNEKLFVGTGRNIFQVTKKYKVKKIFSGNSSNLIDVGDTYIVNDKSKILRLEIN